MYIFDIFVYKNEVIKEIFTVRNEPQTNKSTDILVRETRVKNFDIKSS